MIEVGRLNERTAKALQKSRAFFHVTLDSEFVLQYSLVSQEIFDPG